MCAKTHKQITLPWMIVTIDHPGALLKAAALGPDRSGMSGVERAVLYLCGLETDYRLRELRALKVDCLDFEAPGERKGVA